jgi:hypothetical protein
MSFLFLKHKQYGQHMRKITQLIYSTLFIIAPTIASAFDVNTHAAMTSEAIRQSVITGSPNSSALFKRFGLFDKDYAIGTYYIDIGSLVKRNATPFEREIMRDVREANLNLFIVPTAESIPGWILRGAIREDDNSIETRPGTLQGDEPGGVFDRVFGHFHDPVNNRGLTVRSINVGPVATDWAIKKDTTLSGLGFGSRKNYYNLPAAREAMWRALTLKAWDNGALSDAPEPTNWTFTNKAELRHAYWATMFRAVGDVVHIMQDMAQPQHTRNDPHGGLGCIPGTSTCLGGHASFIENYLKARTLGSDAFRLDEGFASTTPGKPVAIKTEQLQYGGYTKPMFAKAEDFFVSASGSGLANYSNRGFYSFGTNIASLAVPYPAPPPFGAGLVPVTLSGDDPDPSKRLKNMTGQAIPGAKMTFLTGNVIDSAGGANASDVKLTTTGFWDQFMQQQGGASQYTLNYYNYDDQARLLIPRAVAYSAGLIDYFFRGSLEITPPDEGIYSLVDHYDFAGEGQPATSQTQGFKGFKTIKLKLRNTTPDINLSGGGGTVTQGMVSGKLVAVLKFHRNNNYSDDLAGEPAAPQDYINNRSPDEEIIVSDRVKDDTGSVQSTITLPADPNKTAPAKLLYFEFDKELPINATDVRLQIVYRGNLGSEADAVAVETIDISEPTYYTYMNASDYIRLNKKVYTRAEINATGTAPGVSESGSTLRALVQPTSCIDQMTNQLSPSCLNEIAINYPLIFGTPSATNNTTVQIALPQARTYVRLAALTPLTGAIIDQSASNCVPRDPINLVANRMQTDYTETGGSSTLVTIPLPPVRAVKGGSVSCVLIGDGSAPDGSTGWNAQMKALTGVNLKPKQLQNFKFGAP